ncbi:MAG: arsenate reductase ArsC [Gemmatimonadaceae bacterium]|nr:arsenate reductase ArsC [Gemmatimonadaceae bacterium]
MSNPVRVLVLCTGNSARSQIAEALLQTRGAQRPGRRVEAASAGSRPAPRVNPFAVETLAAHGIAWEGRVPQSIEALGNAPFDLVITVCDNARDACPFYAGGTVQVHWGLPDPADHEEPAAARAAFAATYAALDARVQALLALPLEQLAPAALAAAATAIHAAAEADRNAYLRRCSANAESGSAAASSSSAAR